jgi:hypothetical protein
MTKSYLGRREENSLMYSWFLVVYSKCTCLSFLLSNPIIKISDLYANGELASDLR